MARATVLAYHAVGACDAGDDPYNLWVSAAAFADQMAFLHRRCHVVPLDDLVAGRVPRGRPAVAITFDDAYRCVVDHALPVLESHGFPATVFVPTAYLGDRNRWNPPQACDLSILDASELRAAEGRGLTAESHGHRHLDLRTTDDATTRDDLTASRDVLTEVLGRTPTMLAWPYRDGSDAARSVAGALGFRVAFSIDLPHAGALGHGRVQVTPLDGPRTFALKTSGYWLQLRYHPALAAAYRTVKRARATRRVRVS